MRSIRRIALITYDPNHMNENLTKFSSPLKALLPDAIHGLCTNTSVKKGELLFHAGKTPKWMFFVLLGEVTLERLSMKSVKERVLHLIYTEGKNGKYQVNTGIKSLAGELGVTHEALYRTLAALEKARTIKREEGHLTLT